MSARIVVTLTCEYGGNDTAEYDRAMEQARFEVEVAGDEMEAAYPESVRVLDVTVTG